MADDRSSSGDQALAAAAFRRLRAWLVNDAYPLWSTCGVDAATGAFHERLDQHGEPHPEPHRARVQPRQVYAFAQAPGLGWDGDGVGIARRGLATYHARYRRPDGLYRTLVAQDGTPLDESVFLYDQAFALLAPATLQLVAGPDADLEAAGLLLRDALLRHLKRSGPGFDSGVPTALPLLANPHMHLFEACLEWLELGEDPVWREIADEIGTLALMRFIDPVTGALRETFDGHWAPAPGIAGRIVEPGHQFEWAWLLLRWGGDARPEATRAAFRLIEIGEAYGIRNGVAIDALLDDFSMHDPVARLWPQTERLKAAALAASLTGEARHWANAAAAAEGLLRYFATPLPGLWHDRLTPEGNFLPGGAPASSFYHIVAAILAFGKALETAAMP
jgi:mannose-6-phosphate isomerase